MPEAHSLHDALYAQRAIRRFDPRPVPDEVLERIVEAAVRAPSGSNSQGWGFLLVRESELKAQLAAWYQDVWENIYTKVPGRAQGAVGRSAEYLAYHLADAPVLVLPFLRRSGSGTGPSPMSRGASIYPAVQNLMLAALDEGVGSVITTFLQHHEARVKELLGVPAEWEMACCVPLGYPGEGEHFGGARRRPASEVMHFERWGNQG